MTSSGPTIIQAQRATYNAIRQEILTHDFEGQEMIFLPDDAYPKIRTRIADFSSPLCSAYPPFRSFAQKIHNNHTRVFLIGIYSGVSLKFLAQILLRSDLHDEALPFDLNKFAGRNRPSLATLAQDITKLIRWQSSFMPIWFKKGIYSQNIATAAVVLIDRPATTEIASGDTGGVFRAKIKRQFHRFGNSDTFALKRIDDASDAQREIKVLQALMSGGHAPHASIAHIYSGFRFGTQHYLIMENATQNLADLMEADPTGHCVKQNWLLSQFRGLAGALKVIHKGIHRRVIHHHDIKPENILVFQSEHRVTLKLTDWGSASAIQFKAAQSGSPKSTALAQPTYLPPEEASRDLDTSRPHDVWFLGCLFLELIIWHSQGFQKRDQFLDSLTGGRYWRKARDSQVDGELLPVVTQKLTDLAPPVVKKELKDLAPLVVTKKLKFPAPGDGNWKTMIPIIRRMLVVDPRKRVNAGNLARETRRIFFSSSNFLVVQMVQGKSVTPRVYLVRLSVKVR